jgi:hypothetical protein
MIMRNFLILATLAIATSGAAARDDGRLTRSQERVEKALAGKIAGEPKSCLTPQESRSSHNYDGVVLFHKNSKMLWRNDMNGCRLLRESDILSTRLYGSARLCRGDIAEIIDGTGRYVKGACTYGDFVPYRTPG